MAGCMMDNDEWQKLELLHARISMCLINQICLETIDSTISAGIPDPSTDQLLPYIQYIVK